MPLLTLNVLGRRDTSDPISMVAFTFTMRRHLIRLASAPFTSFRLAEVSFELRLLTSMWAVGRMAVKQNAEFT